MFTTNLYALIERRPNHEAFGKPFYVGIGTAKRPYVHFMHARTPKGCRNRLLQITMAAHFALGIEPDVEILSTHETKDEAGKAEKAAIAKYGRVGRDPGGLLCNIASGGQGPDVTLMNDPEIKAKIGAGSSAHWKKPGRKERLSATLKANYEKTPELRQTVTAAMRAVSNANWKDPEKKTQKIAALTGVKKTMTPAAIEARRANLAKAKAPEAAERREAGNLRKWQNPDFRAKRSANQSAAWEDPEKRANMLAGRSDGISKSWADPEVRARRIAGIKAAAAKRAESAEDH